jgi:hypothetical protein
LATIETAVIVVGEEIAVGVVAHDPHVDPVALLWGQETLCNKCGGAVGVEDFGGGPACRVGDVGVGAVSCIAVLVDEVPEFLRGEVDCEAVSRALDYLFLS